MVAIDNNNPNFFKDVDILYEGAGLLNNENNKQYHTFFRILFFKDTCAKVEYRENLYDVKENQVMIIRPNNIYEVKSSSMPILYYDFNFLDKKSIYNIDQLFQKQVLFDIKELNFFCNCFDMSLSEEKQNLGSKILLLSGIGFSLLSLVFRNMSNSCLEEKNVKPPISRDNIFLISEIENCLNADFEKNSRVNNLAYAVGISENKLYKVIKETYGLSPKEWIMQIKIQKIKIMLVERKTYHEIAEKLDFCSVSHMSTVFKKQVGYTPNSYLKKYANK
ncbi:AraC-like DNA-binding protein [Bacilli bacterium PM5-3]|nr:AraC-like DNA-binding protein [Bacilli bacterium PM5-3]MDH6604130.1 AraC-like DNA-binding protein [Bacilli bacterium PM5-9]